MSIEVIHIDCYDPVWDRLETLHVTSSEDFIANGVAYMPCLAEMLDFNQALFDKGTTSGEISVGMGTIVLNNADGKLDKYRHFGFDGRTISVYKPRDKYDTATDDTTLFFTGTVAYVEFGWTKVTIYVKSRLEALNVPMQPNSFDGTNLGAGGDGGFEGGSQLTGKTKPQVFGRCSSVEGVPINEFFLMYAFNYDHEGERAPIYAFYNVYVKGVRYLNANADMATAQDLLDADLSIYGPGYFVTCLAEGVFRLTSTPANGGAVVADVADAPDANCTAAQVVSRILQENALLVAGVDYNAGELEDLDEINACPVGIAISANETIADCVNQILDSIGAWFIPDSRGLFRFGWVDMPDKLIERGAQPVCTITKAQWEDDIERVSVADQSKNVPAQSVEIQHTRNWQTQEKGALADSVGIMMQLFFSTEYRSAKAIDSTVLLAHPLAPALVYRTLLNTGVYLSLLNGDFSVDVDSHGNGWEYGAGKLGTHSQGGGVLTMQCALGFTCYISQRLNIGIDAFPGNIVFGFTVKAGSQITASIDIDGTVVVTGVYPDVVDADSDTSFQLQLPDGVLIPMGASSVGITLASDASGLPVSISSVYAQMAQQGNSPQNEAERRLSIQSSFQERYTMSIPVSYYKENGIDIGKIVTLQDNQRFGLQDGKNFLVIGVDPTDSEFKVQIDVWRAEEL